MVTTSKNGETSNIRLSNSSSSSQNNHNIQQNIGIVVIGRNEGDRLIRCLSILNTSMCRPVVYVDSASSDGSVELASSLGIDTIQLDNTSPLSASRARNEGFYFLLNKHNNLDYIQYIDGDCELKEGWLEIAFNFLEENPLYAVVTGNLNEKFPEESIYNLLCDIEWKTNIGEIKSCGGIFMARMNAFLQVNGFNTNLIAGEEPDLCFRLRQIGWRIYKIKTDMASHDANIKHFSQWWKRTKRSGFAYANGLWIHGKKNERFRMKETFGIWFWAFLLPVCIVVTSLLISQFFIMLSIAYFLLFFKITLSKHKDQLSWKRSMIYGFFTVLGKFPQFLGLISFYYKSIFNRESKIIDYKRV